MQQNLKESASKVLQLGVLAALALIEATKALDIVLTAGPTSVVINSYLSMELAPSSFNWLSIDIPVLGKVVTIGLAIAHSLLAAILTFAFVNRLIANASQQIVLPFFSIAAGLSYYLLSAGIASFFKVSIFATVDLLILYLAAWAVFQLQPIVEPSESS